jgi:release factor glutamine methyltransferase
MTEPAETAVAERLRAAGCVFAEDEAQLLVSTAHDDHELESMVQRRVEGLPLEHVLGWVEFCGRRFAIEPGVFVPRPRTEFLVRQAAAIAGPDAVVLDLCCGSGAVGVALADAIEAAELHASDSDPVAVACARRNVQHRGEVYQGDLFEPLPVALRGRVDILVAIAPYVPTAAIDLLPREARLHEPLTTLDGGADGLDLLRRVLAEAHEWLSPSGVFVTEVSEDQVAPLMTLVVENGLVPKAVRDDELDATAVIAERN